MRTAIILALALAASGARADDFKPARPGEYDLGESTRCATKDCRTVVLETIPLSNGDKALSIAVNGSEICYQLRESNELHCRLDAIKPLLDEVTTLRAENRLLRAMLKARGRKR